MKKEIHINVGRASKIDELPDNPNIPKQWYQPATTEELYSKTTSQVPFK